MAILMRIPALLACLLIACLLASQSAQAVRIMDIADVDGMRSNALIGYGLVVGLAGTGDTYNMSPFTINSVTAMLQHFGINVEQNLSYMKPKNVAAVMVTAQLPPFARPGQKLDVTVSSLGNATSLRGGTLLVTPLMGGDNQAYAVAQGSVTLGGYSAAGQNSSTTVGHTTAGRIPNGANIEKAAPTTLRNNQPQITLDLRQADFTTALHMQDAINAKLGDGVASAINAGTIVVNNSTDNAVELLASLESIDMTTDHPATVVVDERTGTIVMGEDVQIDTVAVAHGNLSVSISESPQVSQPNAFGSGTTTTVNRTSVQVHEKKAKFVMLRHKASLNDLVTALNSVGATPSDLIAVLQAIKAAGALHAELKII